MEAREWHAVITAAQSGDRAAMDRLVAGWLPLVYNIVGRALGGHADVDDVVQETMLRVVHRLPSLREPDRFRSWLVAITMRQIRERARRRGRAAEAAHAAAPAAEPAALPAGAADFADLTVARLHLQGQRREVAEAARWLDDEDRQLLALWWLEVAGELSRRDLAAALGVSRAHAAVRVQRMKERLETARGIVRVLAGPQQVHCADLRALLAPWDGRPVSVWRKRLARHIRGCPRCGAPRRGIVPAERLLVGLALVPLPTGFALSLALGGKSASAALVTTGWSAKVLAALGKPAAAVTAGATLAAGGAALLVYERPADPPPRSAAPSTSSPAPPARPDTPPPTSAPPSPRPTATTEPPSPRPAARYGSVVDAVDEAPDPGRPPGPLPRRADRGLTSTGGPSVNLTHRGETATLRGTGYVRLRWQILPVQRPGGLVMASWTGLEGRLFHVASGGGRRMDDLKPGSPDETWMGSPAIGYTVLPAGTQQMWQNEYFWLDGTVTLNQNERGADYNLIIQPTTYEDVELDLRTAPDPQAGIVRYGLVRDTGDNRTPVPQYLTRSRPADPAEVPRDSEVGE
ncbi:sigma-70 family RNA polymerase sigma factor [Streptomyces sp. WMMC500]|uniref:RNA polymerase sigma factor n=1 Tax=Streptomyces sp. WMMC500 TaxID=3015154 RepID=UPI00248BA570|nr:sigma-70 family RNA polymerase sigma factor [Streptomyces sp. WMMC500]WBB57726.1 sigma-70 family RNA polymerase sigma factor [Streptomyces sp. WMMC500]